MLHAVRVLLTGTRIASSLFRLADSAHPNSPPLVISSARKAKRRGETMLAILLLSMQPPISSSSAVRRMLPSLFLAVLVVVAAAYLVLSRPSKRGHITLPTHDDAQDATGPAITPPKIDFDREMDVERYYRRLRVRKLATIIVLLLLVSLNLFALAWDGLRGASKVSLIDTAIMIVFWSICAYMASASYFLTNTDADIDRHWDYTVALASLTAFVLLTTTVRIILPATTSPVPSHHLPKDVYIPIMVMLVTNTLLQLLAFLLTGNTRRCAPLAKKVQPLKASELYNNEVKSASSPSGYKAVTDFKSCSPLSYVLFDWLSPVLAVGAKVETLSEDDMPSLAANDRAPNLWEKMRIKSGKGGPKWMNPLLYRVLSVNRHLFIWQTVLAGINAFIYYLPAFFLHRFVKFLEERNETPGGSLRWGYTYSLGLFSVAVLDALVGGQLWFVSNSMLSTRIRVQLNTLVFDKTLRRKDVAGVSMAAQPPSEDGEGECEEDGEEKGRDLGDKTDFGSKSAVLNLWTIDVDRVADFSVWCFSIIDTPMEIIIGTFFLYKLLDYAAFIGILVAVFFIPLNHWTSSAFADVQDKLMAARDKRVSLMNEVLQSIRMIKYMAFEEPFEKRIMEARAFELKQLRRNYLLEVSFSGIWGISPILCVIVSFYVYTNIIGKELTPSIAFASLAVWNELRFALNSAPEVFVNAIQCLVSLRRLQRYLDTPEVEVVTTDDPEAPIEAQSPDVAFRSATVTWPQKNDSISVSASGSSTPAARPFELQEISVDFPRGKMSLITGPLGSGKTLLLLALLGECDVLAGEVVCPRSPANAILLPSIDWETLLTEDNWLHPNHTAFVPQTAWLQNASIRANICFGLPFRASRYKQTLEACSLDSDLSILPDGDMTEIGEKGVNLSGGQKARVSLARAVYSRATLLLLDDVLSAVDAHTASHIFNKCLKGPLMEGRTILLVSHHVQLTAPGVDFVVSLDNGRVAFSGDAASFREFGGYKLADEDEPAVEALAKHASPSAKFKNKVLVDLVAESVPVSETNSSASEAESDDEDDEHQAQVTALDGKGKAVDAKSAPRKLIEEESRAIGTVKWDVWKLYLGLWGGAFFWICFIVAFGGAKLADVAQSLWLARWSASYEIDADATTGRKHHSVNYYLGIYCFLSLLAVVLSTLQWFVLYVGSLRASDRIYRIILKAILRAPLRFFDTQALGRLLNRFGKDTEAVDSQLPDNFGRALMFGLGVITTLNVIASVAPTFLIGFGIVGIAYWWHARLFAKNARELRRLDSVAKSPLYSIYGEAVAGVSVIRAFGSGARFMEIMLELASTQVTYYWTLWSVNRWLSVRFQLLSALVLGLTGVVLLQAGDSIDASLAGFALTFALSIAGDMLFLVRRFTSLELSMVSVERIKEYSEVKQEAAEIIEPRPPAHWPSKGAISVEKLAIRYAPELPDVLHSISFTVAPGEKVGIVGATGSGKSTITLAMFRFMEAWKGRIVVDGIDIAKVGLKDLRQRLTIIPQDPTILSGTLRSTLDTFDEFTDLEIFDALRRVQLIKPNEQEARVEDGANRSPFFDLESEVSEGGQNFSQGQRQLLTMARALLKRNKILLLDEATASVDYKTDELITQTISEEFNDSTLLVIAHRLRTVIGFNKILLLDAGKILEYDSPSKLLADSTSRFHALCRATGRSEFRILKKMAEGKIAASHKNIKVGPQGSSLCGFCMVLVHLANPCAPLIL
ncbi:BQ2448_3803 [Microbotryum intermedium]|uniref:BQ2448_3803 protein n=1 Tax=Microbotryum intermedium TaxID=269621 RepID=A0A238FFY3_9BASI|nr:BQ2448_3803 [Microbotryum intermedium]